MNDRWSSSGAPEAAGCQPRGGRGPRPQRSCPGSASEGRAAFGAGPARGRGGVGGPRPQARGNQGPSGQANEKSPEPSAAASPPGPAPRARPVAPRRRGRREPGPAWGPGGRPKRDKTSRRLGRKARVPASPGPSVEVGSLRGPRPAGWRPSPIGRPARCTRPALSHRARLRPGAFPGRKPCEPRCSVGPRVDPG